MAERSFAKEVEKLRAGNGDEFRGEGILAVTKALLQSGVGYVAGYQGAPISHLMDVLSDGQEILSELGVHFESSASEAAAAATLSASVHYPIRGAATFKSTVGLNVASDALANLSSGGVTGGAIVITGEDYGEGSSIMQERSYAFAMKSQMWLVDPRPNLPSIVQAVENAFELSEASNTPVLLKMRIRACHVTGSFIAKDNRRPTITTAEALESPRRDTARVVLPPAAFAHEQEKVKDRWPRAVEFVESRKLNETFGPEGLKFGIVLQGGMYNAVNRALERLGLSDCYGESQVPLYVLNVTYPIVDREFLEYCDGKDSILVVEEGQPAYLEHRFRSILQEAGRLTRVRGKGDLPAAGEYTGQAMFSGIQSYLRDFAPDSLPADQRAPNRERGPAPEIRVDIPIRPPGFCTGCPERPIFAALKLVQQELGEHHVSADIGCHLFGALPPFEVGTTTMGYGLGPASSSAFNVKAGKRVLSIIGDGGFWHNGLSSGLGNAVYNQQDGVILVVDNYYTSATGGQTLLSSRAASTSRSTNHRIEDAAKGLGVKWVRRIDRTYNVQMMRDVLREALTTSYRGPKVIVASSECMLNRQRRERPLLAEAINAGKRVVKPKFGVDEDVCTGDHACMRLSGCPSLSMKKLDDPLREDPVANIDQSCVGCGNCGEVAHAAVLCPSFYQADLVQNPTGFEHWWSRVGTKFTSALQRRRSARRLQF